MVLTDQLDTSFYPAASLETLADTIYYSNITNTRVALPTGGYPANNPIGNGWVAKLSGAVGGNKIGPGITLKVMAGDKFNANVNSFWSTATANAPNSIPVADLVAALAGGVAGAGGKVTATELINTGVLSPGASGFLSSQAPPPSKPKAYLNWVLFDEQFNIARDTTSTNNIIATGYSGSVPVGAAGSIVPLPAINKLINKSGYLYIYVSNETPNIDVFFDELSVSHIKGPITESRSFYPFGLEHSGLSSVAANFGKPVSKIKFNGYEQQNNEWNDGKGLEWYDYKNRFYDNQIARFFVQDRLGDKYVYYSPYQFAGNEVPNAIDLDGLEPLSINKGVQNLVLIVQGVGENNPPDGATQASNAAKTDPALGPDTELGSIGSSGSTLQVGIFASSRTENTKNDLLTTITSFRKINPDGKVILVGHSQGADNIVELVNQNKNVKINLLVTLDIKDASGFGIFSIDDNKIPSNVMNAINYYQKGEFIGGEKIRVKDMKLTNGINILSPGSNHRSIDNDLLPYIIQDMNNLLNGKNPVKEASKRILPQFDPANSNSTDIF